LVGSGRSIAGFDITAALAEIAPNYLERFGGHASACGLTLKSEESFLPFTRALNGIADKKISEEDLVKSVKIDMALTMDQITWDLTASLNEMAPFGMNNPRPRFASAGVKVSEARTMGSDGQHLRLMLWQNNTTREAVSFGNGAEWGSKLSVGDTIDVAYEIDINEWNHERRLQLKVVDIKKTK
jgi:single-stranded-DNA-specific exonuclease